MPCQAWSNDSRPASDADLMMLVYHVSTTAAHFGVRTPSSQVEFALYSDGTVLAYAGSRDLRRLPRFVLRSISTEVARRKVAAFSESFRDMKAIYRENCWQIAADGSRYGSSCADDAGFTSIVLNAGAAGYKTVSVEAAQLYGRLPDIEDFVPAEFFNAMFWAEDINKQPATMWRSPYVIVVARDAERTVSECLPAPRQEIPEEDAKMTIALPQGVKAKEATLVVADQYVPHLASIDYFRDEGLVQSCP